MDWSAVRGLVVSHCLESDCRSVEANGKGAILALVDVAKGAGEHPSSIPDYISFAVNNLDEIFERAKSLNCLAKDRFHDQNAGEIVKRPWGEVSFYAEDPWGNGLCFVDQTTLFTGK